jgi:pimeloyl-ACP methyl ester carboxylesterase
MGRASHELARSAPTEGGRAGASDPTLPSVALTGFDHRVTLPGGDRISYVDIGPMTGRPVLYLHGTPGARLMAAGLEDAAGELGLRVLAPDRSGCGGSTFHRDQVRDYARFIARFADARGIAEFGVIGVSGGGRCAWACAPELGARVSGSRSSRARRRRSCRVCETHGADRIVSSTRSPIGRRGCSELVLAGWARGVRHDPDRLWSLFNDLPAVDLVVLERPGFRAGVDAIIPRGRPAGRPRTDSRSRTQRRNSGGCPRPPMLLSCVSRQAESSYRTPPNPGQTISPGEPGAVQRRSAQVYARSGRLTDLRARSRHTLGHVPAARACGRDRAPVSRRPGQEEGWVTPSASTACRSRRSTWCGSRCA